MPDFTSTFKSSPLSKILLLTAFCAFFNLNILRASHEGHEDKGATHTKTEVSNEHEIAGVTDEPEKPIGKQVSDMILGHIGDNHYWDAFGHYVLLPLPCIVYTESQGLQFFMSSQFHHGEHAYNGMKLVNMGAKIVWEDAAKTEKIYDFSITKVAATVILGSIVLLVIFIGVARTYKKRAGMAPKGFQNLIESLFIFMRDGVIKSSVGPRYKQFMPLLMTIFWFIFIVNLMGNIPFFPGGANATGNIAIPLVMALVVLLYVSVNANKNYWKHIFLPDVPVGLYILLIPIEILGFFLRPFVLMLRLFANITAGHIIILGFFSLIFIFGSMKEAVGYSVAPASVAFTIFMGMLELLVSFLQAFVFTLLSSLYIGMAIEEHGHEHATEKH
ncbi:MAG: F0F1 ATP synthase subunit A [Bacteroidetes bacterium]|nr:F0F1 ATP synthase subunit A [Bacteroidota bacterium]